MSTPALPEKSAAALTESQRLLYTFTAPAKTMADLRRNASWWVPWLLVSIVSVAFTYTLDKKIGWAQAIETQIQEVGLGQPQPCAIRQVSKLLSFRCNGLIVTDCIVIPLILVQNFASCVDRAHSAVFAFKLL